VVLTAQEQRFVPSVKMRRLPHTHRYVRFIPGISRIRGRPLIGMSVSSSHRQGRSGLTGADPVALSVAAPETKPSIGTGTTRRSASRSPRVPCAGIHASGIERYSFGIGSCLGMPRHLTTSRRLGMARGQRQASRDRGVPPGVDMASLHVDHAGRGHGSQVRRDGGDVAGRHLLQFGCRCGTLGGDHRDRRAGCAAIGLEQVTVAECFCTATKYTLGRGPSDHRRR